MNIITNSPPALSPAKRANKKEAFAEKPKRGIDLLKETPDMVVGSNVIVRGDMKFEGLIKIDGLVEGRVAAPMEATLILTQSGVFNGDITGLSVAYLDGKVTGDIAVEYLYIGSNAVIRGDIICKALEVDAHAIIVGQLNVSMKSIITSAYVKSDPLAPPAILDPSEYDGENSPLKRAERQANEDEADGPETEDDIPMAPSRSYKNVLFIHEPQVDFYGSGGGAAQVGEKISEFVENNLEMIDEIYVTLDSHYKMHMAQRTFWCNSANGEMPAVGDRITIQDIRDDVWLPRKPELKDYCIHILEAQHSHCSAERPGHSMGDGVTIKAEHCSIGSQGGAILPAVNAALSDWVNSSLRNVNYITRDVTFEAHMNKHSNSATSGNTAVLEDQATMKQYCEVYDMSFLKQYSAADNLLICGQAACHCAHFSVLDVVRTATAMSSLDEEREETDGESGLGIPSAHVFILKDALTTSEDQLGIGAPSDGHSASSRSVVEEFWNGLRLAGVKISSTVEAMLKQESDVVY